MSEPADRDPLEVDPTGIRDLLASMPDPGPMPEDLVRRIEARLEVEQAAREQGVPHPLGRHTERVVDLATERGRRRPGRTLLWLGAAAAGLVVTAAVVPQLVDGMDSGDAGTAAYYPTRDQHDTAADGQGGGQEDGAGGGDRDAAGEPTVSSLDEGGIQDEAAEDEGAEGGAADDGAAGDGADGGGDPASPAVPLLPLDGDLVLLPDLGVVEREELTETLLRAVAEQDAGPVATPPRSEALTEGQAGSCWRGLADTRSFDRYVAAPAQVVLPDGRRQGDRVVALLGLHDDGSAESWVMPHSCTGDPGTLPIMQGEPRD